MSSAQTLLRSSEKADFRSRSERINGADLDNIFPLATPSDRSKAAASDPRRASAPDLDEAFDMLTRAAKAMDLMQARYQHVEEYAKSVAERAEKDLAAAYAKAQDWEKRALSSETELDDFKARLAEVERRAEQAERSAADAREWLESFYDKIVTCFDSVPFSRPSSGESVAAPAVPST